MRYEAVMGVNTKQWWIYDNENDSYIDPPIDVLEELNEDEERCMEKINKEEPDWLHDGNEYFDEDFEI